MDQAYKYMASTCLTLNNTKDIIENIPKNEEIKFGGTKITSSNINARKHGIGSFSTREEEGH